MRHLLRSALPCFAVTSLCPADVTFEWVADFAYASDISADGSVVVGSLDNQGVFRWTEVGGFEDLGRSPGMAGLPGAGFPTLSADGSRVIGTILDDTGAQSTPGVWTLGSGWSQLMPPSLPDGGTLDNSWGSGWGLSFDGTAACGLYWRPDQPGGLAHAFTWSESAGLVDLGSSGSSSRASGMDGDGNVVVGFDEDPAFGNRRAAVWVDGNLTILNPDPSEASRVNPAGSIIVGNSLDENFAQVAALWRWNGSSWAEEILGTLPGTDPIFGSAVANDLTPDGRVVVGLNSFSFFGGRTGFIWTPSTGMVDVVDFLRARGIDTSNFDVDYLAGVSDDGRYIVGTAFDLNTFTYRAFRITIPPIDLTVDTSCPDAGLVDVNWGYASPNGRIALLYARNTGSVTIPGGYQCAGTPLSLGSNRLQLVRVLTSDSGGNGTLNANAPASVCGGFLQILDLNTCLTSDAVRVD